MRNEKQYLRSNVVVEPLVRQWYAWTHLIPPATASRNVAERQMKIMRSYVQNPQIHAAACKDPAMAGGPFIDYGGQRSDEIHELMERTLQEERDLIAFGEALGQLDDLLREEALGYSLTPLYGRIPEILRGYVELVYDLNNHASFRLVEPLLYRSQFYRPDSQSMMLSLIHDDHRPFIFSTPRLQGPDEVHVRCAFKEPAIDSLFQAKRIPQSVDALAEALGVEADDKEKFAGFFTSKPPEPYQPYEGSGMRWRYFGHACILLEAPGVSIMVDPVLSYTYESGISRYTYDDLPDHIDYVLITHNHTDHILFETVLQLRHKIGTLVVPRGGCGSLQDPSLQLALRALGFDNVVEIGEMDELALPDGSITGIPFFGEHADLDIQTKLAYIVRLGRHSILFAADSCNIEPVLYQHVHDALGDVDVLFLGMECVGAPLSWIYGPLLLRPLQHNMDQARRLSGSNYDQAMEIVSRFNFKEVYVYAMGLEPWLDYIFRLQYTDQSRPIVDSNRVIEECKSRNMTTERLFGEKEILLP